MTEQQKRIPERRLGQDEDQDVLWAPESYPSPDLDSEGRWAVVGDGDGIIWTDDLESAGVTWVTQTPRVQALWRHFQVAKGAGTPAGVAYQIALNQGGVGEEQTGELSGFAAAFEDLMYPGE